MIMPRSGPGRDGALLSCRPELKGTRPSRPRPWQAVAVAETAGHESGGGSVTGAPRTLAEVSPRHGDVGKSRVPPVFHNDHPGEFALIVAIRRKVRTHPSPDLTLGRDGHGSSTFLTSLCPLPHGPLTSRASRGGHSLPGPPRDARDVARTGATAPNDAVPEPTLTEARAGQHAPR